MTRRRHTKEQILEGAVQTALTEGLSRLSFGRVAAHLDTNDRTVVYYFPTKDDLVGAVLVSLGVRLQDVLAEATTAKAQDHLALVRAIWPAVATEAADPVFALFFEANGLAAAGIAPYDELVPALVGSWVDWAADRIEGRPTRRRAEAEAAIALVDGLLLLRSIRGADAAARAAKRLGI